MMRRLRIALWALVALALVGVGTAVWLRSNPATEQADAAIQIGGPFSMVDQNGKSVTEKDYAGKAKAMFFGFTYCPDICPTTLARLSGLMEKLGTDADQVQVILVSVDPERDTPQVLKEYLQAFDPGFAGLTGTPEQLASFAKNYRFFYEKVPDASGSYTMNHSAGVYLYDTAGKFQGTLDAHETDEVAIAKFKRLVGG